MNTFESFEEVIYTTNERTFNEIALKLFHFQAHNNPVYYAYLKGLNVSPANITRVEEIPFLPISFFKTRSVKTGDWTEEITFASSGTTGKDTSHHHVKHKAFYLDNAVKCFQHFYGPPDDYVFLALLPSYLDRQGSSLVSMVDHFIQGRHQQDSGYYKDDHQRLADKLLQLRKNETRVILWGVSFALLDFAENYPMDLGGCIVVETGGMKGRRPEITREELHNILRQRLNLSHVSSEYGMTELLSQAYSKKNGVFFSVPWLKAIIRDPEDPREWLPTGRAGGINIIDLANIHSCAFVETQDLGRAGENGSFEVLGRLDNSDIRGCNLLG